jgi:phosphatidate cytidylyltransferase
MSNLVVRSITGALFVTLILGSIFWSEVIAFSVITGFMILGIIEFYTLFKNNDIVRLRWELPFIMTITIYGLFSLAMFDHIPNVLLMGTFPLIFLYFLTELWRKKNNPLINISVGLFGLIYVGLPFFLMVLINHFDQSLNWLDIGTSVPLLAAMFIIVWTNDTFAYLTGRFLGKHKLFERVSPKKTWEGTIGGIAFAVGAGVLISLYSSQFDLIFWIISAVLISLSSIFGDLLESLFKRSLKIKDSGSILPGHGGILDRFDAAIFAAPMFLFWVYINVYLFN